MKVLHVGYSDTRGGAAIAMMRLHQSLIDINVDSKVLVAEKISNDSNVIGPSKSLEVILYEIKQILARQKKYIFKKNDNFSHSLNIFRSNIVKKINEINPDIVNLHWINNELMSIGQINEIKQPIVWTFVDMWPMCGGEHYTETRRYRDGYLKSNKDVKGFDLNRWLWNKKKKNWEKKIKKVVCISEWLKEKAMESDLFSNSKVEKINCNLDLSLWKPVDKNEAKNILNLPSDKKIFLFVSTNGIEDKRKGFEFVDNALNNLSNSRNDFQLLILGKANSLNKKKYEYKVIDKLLNGNPIELRLIYSACDLILAPSTLEAFGQVALEGASCGTPTVAFNKTGILDIIEHKVNGYLSNYKDQEDFNEGINWILNNDDKNLLNNCLKVTKEKFDSRLIANKYLDIYKSLS
tara:strand:- start:14 stop:1234 length:1221 start_codon:yes stop_codon:yes gene_type:complete